MLTKVGGSTALTTTVATSVPLKPLKVSVPSAEERNAAQLAAAEPVHSSFQASFGGKLRFVLTASAPISPAVLSFLRAVLGCFIFEGYGQTECTAGCTFSMPGDWSTGDT